MVCRGESARHSLLPLNHFGICTSTLPLWKAEKTKQKRASVPWRCAAHVAPDGVRTSPRTSCFRVFVRDYIIIAQQSNATR